MPKYPDALLDWSGNRAGGVKKLFYAGSGRPSGLFVRTPLLSRLEDWANRISLGATAVPRAVLLVGGPGNGKTEAVEFTVSKLDAALNAGGHLVEDFTAQFLPSPPRLATVQRDDFPAESGVRAISIVQDASSVGAGATTSPAALLVEDVVSLLEGDQGRVYLACVNRGILDDALIIATEGALTSASALLKKVIEAVSLSAESPRCWPLEGFPQFGVWPMDVETLIEDDDGEPAASQILSAATKSDDWPEQGSCAAGEMCPFCTSKALLSKDQGKSSFLRMLRHYELASGKRWNFRDLFSLTAHILAGESDEISKTSSGPCGWAAATLAQKGVDQRRIEVQRKRALLQLLARQYPHSMFSHWPVDRARQLNSDIADLKLRDVPALVALQLFLSRDHRQESTSTLRSRLSGLSEYLDPAFASPSFLVMSEAKPPVHYEDLDRRFSLSIRDGRDFLVRHKSLTPLESAVLKDLQEVDEKLSTEDVRRARPATAERIQALLRLVASRIARRSIGARAGITRDFATLDAYHQLARGDLATFKKATHQVEELLNSDRRFVVSLNTTFGEPLPPPERRALLTMDVQRVRPHPGANPEGRPELPMRFLKVGNTGAKPVALTYDLFKATQMLQEGMVPASLPRSVVALLDTTRARLAGAIVRNDEELENSEMSLGVRDDKIGRSFGRFLVK